MNYLSFDSKPFSLNKEIPEDAQASSPTDTLRFNLQPTRSPAYSPRVEAVIQEARRVFGKRCSNPEDLKLDKLCFLLSNILVSDVNEKLPLLQRGQVGYVSLENSFEDTNFTIGVFLLAPGSTIPLHDHPEMCVVSQVVYGSVDVTSFDFDFSSKDSIGHLVDKGRFFAPCNRILFPHSGGNLHSFSTETGCIILDVMSPPYDESEGRECTYYNATSVDGLHFQLRPIETPIDFEVLDLSS